MLAMLAPKETPRGSRKNFFDYRLTEAGAWGKVFDGFGSGKSQKPRLFGGFSLRKGGQESALFFSSKIFLMEHLNPFDHLAVKSPRALEKEGNFLNISSCIEIVPHVLFTPLHYEPGYAYPLVVWLHGPGTDERQLIRLMPKISLRNYVAVAVRGLETPSPRSCSASKGGTGHGARPRYGWPQTRDAIAEASQRVFRAIEIACSKRHIHPRRIFLAGSRSGGTMAFRIVLQEPSYFAGVISLGGRLPSGHLFLRNFSKLGHLEVLLGVTRNSPCFPTTLVCENLRILHRAGVGGIMLREYPPGWHLSFSMLRDVDRWLMELITQGATAHQK